MRKMEFVLILILLLVGAALAVLLPIRATRILVAITLLGLASKPLSCYGKDKDFQTDPHALIWWLKC